MNQAACLTALTFALGGEASDQLMSRTTWQAHPSATATIEGWSNLGKATRPGHEATALAEVGIDVRKEGPVASEQGWFAKGRSVLGRTDASVFEAASGAFNPVSSIAANRHTRLVNLYYWHHWDSGRFRIKLGRLAIDDDFMISEFATPLLHSAFGAMPSQVSIPLSDEAGYAVYPLAAPGVWFSVEPDSRLRGQCGIYSGSSGRDNAQNYGWEWQHSDAAGVVAFSEVKWQRDRSRPALHVGASYHTGQHDNYDALLHGHGGPTVHAVWNAYVMIDAVVTRHRNRSAQLGAFVRAGVSPQPDRSTVSHYADAGLSWSGPIPTRPADVLALGISTTWFESAYRELAGLRATETTAELTYRCQLTSRFGCQADIQRLRPAGIGRTPGGGGHPATTIIGARVTVQL